MEHKLVQRDIDSLIFAEYNPRQLTKEQYKNLKDSIDRFGLVDPILVNKNKDRKNIIIGGHQRVKVAKDMNIKEVPVLELDLTYERERELNVRLNRNTGEWDMDSLANFFEVDELVDWGFDEDELILPEEEVVAGLTEDDDVPGVEESICKEGDLWILGEHRLLCGDATKKEDVDKLMDGNKADMVFTDPPYGIGYEYNSHKDKKGDEYLEFCDKWFNNIKAHTNNIIITTGWAYQKYWINKDPYDIIYWICRNKMSGGKVSHFRRCEPILFWGEFKKILDDDFIEVYVNSGFLNKHEEANKNLLLDKHTCPKPIELYVGLFKNIKYKSVLDIFLGSGSTLIACEKTGRKCYGMEIDPYYCDVIIKRWEDYTGKVAKLHG